MFDEYIANVYVFCLLVTIERRKFLHVNTSIKWNSAITKKNGPACTGNYYRGEILKSLMSRRPNNI
jgi:hypothetical protein